MFQDLVFPLNAFLPQLDVEKIVQCKFLKFLLVLKLKFSNPSFI